MPICGESTKINKPRLDCVQNYQRKEERKKKEEKYERAMAGT